MRRQPVARRPGIALALRRRPRVRTAIVLAAGLACGVFVAATVRHAEQVRDAWGRSTQVLIATRDLAAGTLLDRSNTRVVERPAPLVPGGALSATPAHARLSTPVFEGEVLTGRRLAPAGMSEVAARLPEGTLAMAVPVPSGTAPPLAVGDTVDIIVALAPEAAAAGPPGFTLASHLAVVDVADQAVTVAVPRDTAPRLAVALGAGAVSLALSGG